MFSSTKYGIMNVQNSERKTITHASNKRPQLNYRTLDIHAGTYIHNGAGVKQVSGHPTLL